MFQPGKNPELRGTNSQTKLSSHLKIKVQSSLQRSDLESNAGKSVTEVLLPQPLEPALVSTGLLLTTSWKGYEKKMYLLGRFRYAQFLNKFRENFRDAILIVL